MAEEAGDGAAFFEAAGVNFHRKRGFPGPQRISMLQRPKLAAEPPKRRVLQVAPVGRRSDLSSFRRLGRLWTKRSELA